MGRPGMTGRENSAGQLVGQMTISSLSLIGRTDVHNSGLSNLVHIQGAENHFKIKFEALKFATRRVACWVFDPTNHDASGRDVSSGFAAWGISWASLASRRFSRLLSSSMSRLARYHRRCSSLCFRGAHLWFSRNSGVGHPAYYSPAPLGPA